MTKKESTITGIQLQEAMLRRQISADELARKIGVLPSTIYNWCRNGVPPKRCRSISTKFLDDVEREMWGANHMDMFPELIPDDAL